MANLLKLMDSNRTVIKAVLLGASTETKQAFTQELLKLRLENADISFVAYPEGTPKEYLSKDIKGTVAGFFPNAGFFESKMEKWEKVAFGGAQVDWDNPEYWHLRGYVPSKDPEGKVRKAIQKLSEDVDALFAVAVERGILGKKATFSTYFKQNNKGKAGEGLEHTFAYDQAYKNEFYKAH